MKKLISFLAVFLAVPASFAEDLSMQSAIENVKKNCVGISAELNDLKKLAGINTAVSSVGTLAGGGALGTGIVKAQDDAIITDWKKVWAEMEREMEAKGVEFKKLEYTQEDIDNIVKQAILQGQQNMASQIAKTGISELEEESKKLGNWRTGLMATSSAANIASAVMAGKSNSDVRKDLSFKIGACMGSVEALKQFYLQARIDKEVPAEDLKKAEKIVEECGAWDTVELEKLDTRTKGAVVSSAIGASTGIAGTVTSAVANNQEIGTQKAKNLNTGANVLAGVTTGASLTSTIFNATQISAIKRASEIADSCEEVLK